MISPDSNYLLCFGQGCHFLKLPDIYHDIQRNHKLSSISEIEKYYRCNARNVRNLFDFQSFPTISVVHFIDDHRLIFAEYYDSTIGIVPSEQELYLLDLNKISTENRSSCKSLGIFGHQDQYVTSGHGLIAFSSGKYTKYAPNHLIKGNNASSSSTVETKNHLWIYKVNDIGGKSGSKLLGHNYILQEKVKTHWRAFHQNMQIVKREYDGMNVDQYWLIAFNRGAQKINIFDVRRVP